MPAKPIKHCIKVYAICCSFTGYLYAFEIYTGIDHVADGSPRGVISRLLFSTGVTSATSSGRILYTDNFYTSQEVMKYIFFKYGMLLVGTYALTKKKLRTSVDYPFHKLSNSALRRIPPGWKRMAFQKVESNGKLLYVMQATMWKDKKLVGFLHNHLVTDNADDFVRRWSPLQKKMKKISSHRITHDYAHHMNCVDHKDRDTADWTISLKSNRFYLRIFYWLLDSVLHAMYTIVKAVALSDDHPWYKYKNKNYGRYKFQMDLGYELIRCGLEMDWLAPYDKEHKPSYVQKQITYHVRAKTVSFVFKVRHMALTT